MGGYGTLLDQAEVSPLSKPSEKITTVGGADEATMKSYKGVVARFDSGAIWAAFPPLCSLHHGVGLRPAELGHPVEDVTPDHNLSLLRVAVPRLQAASHH